MRGTVMSDIGGGGGDSEAGMGAERSFRGAARRIDGWGAITTMVSVGLWAGKVSRCVLWFFDVWFFRVRGKPACVRNLFDPGFF